MDHFENQKPKAVLLDVGGVLLLPDPALVAGPLESAGVKLDEEALRRAHYQAVAATDQAGVTATGLASDHHWYEYARACGVPNDLLSETTARFVEVFRHDFGWWHVIPGAREVLERLSDQVLVGLISNGGGLLEDALKRLQFCQIGSGVGSEIAVLIDSGVVGVGKPDPRIFQLALDKLGVTADQALLVGDTVRTDMEGARRMGIAAFHLDPFGDCPQPDHGHAHIRDFDETYALVSAP